MAQSLGDLVVRVGDIRPTGSGVVVRAGTPNRAVSKGAVIDVDGADFEAAFEIPGFTGDVQVELEFLRDGLVVSRATASGSRPTVFVNDAAFGVRSA